ncbi:competence type IV pilus assembly protein ComGB [Bacillus sp. FJAT-47783]|uniref:competence type IV pilus assembly protein ComGB n=1 Tax=Bacillus sp. FJAT-47783 TaxID=2922712 RepID=UPI001FAD0BD9|nr:competence type IV pilus assembly protein ComGB [Bacillus sp. FJAT-47783]
MKKSKWSLKKQAQVLKRISDLLEQGYSLNEAITFTMLHLPPPLKRDMKACVQTLTKGNSLRSALQQLGFHRHVLSYLYFAENYGDVKRALHESSRLLNKQLLHAEKAKQILRYPLFLLLFMGMILYAVETIIAPQFIQMYESMNVRSSIFLFLLLSLFDFLTASIIVIGIVCVLVIPFYFFVFRNYSATKQIAFILKIPLLKRIFMLYQSYYFSFQMSFLLKGGLSIFESLMLFNKQPLLPIYKEETERMISDLTKGRRLDEILSECSFFESELAAVVHHGQTSGRLDRELYTYSQMIVDRLEQSMMKIMSYIQPGIFLVIGILVLAVYLSIMLPMYQMMETV